MATRNLIELLRMLEAAGVEFVVVGGMAGVMQGAPVVTADIDIVHRRTAENVARLLGVLGAIDARYRRDPRGLAPGESHLLGPGPQLLQTRLGPLDVLGEIGGGGYQQLLPDAIRLQLGEGLSVKVLGLAKLVELKRAAGRPKDLAVLPVLEATLELLRRKG
jgi:hypothetical protein